MQAADLGERIWRARRRHSHIDAVVQRHLSTSGVDSNSGDLSTPEVDACELKFFHDDRLIVSWPFESREAAVEEATRRLRELQRVGWNVHW